jgi:hypothetical protein
MNISKPVKVLIGIATVWYLFYLVLFGIWVLILFGYVAMSLLARGGQMSDLETLFTLGLPLEIIIPVHLCSLLLEIGLLIFYLVHIIKNPKVDNTFRVLFILGHLFLPFIVMPVYYYLYIWLESPPEWARAQTRKVTQQMESVVQ